MKKIFLMTAVLILPALFLAMCKDQAGNTTRQAYIISVDGASVKKSADTASESICVIPFGCPVEVADNTGAADSSKGWSKARWESTEGWVRKDGTGDIKSVQDRISVSGHEEKKYLSEKVNRAFDGMYSITRTFFYTGGEMEPASMLFLSNGVLALNSTIFSEKQQINYFSYEFLSDGRLLKIYFSDDSRVNFAEYRVVEEGNSSVFRIDDNEKSIIYQVKEGSVNFFNWVFIEKK
ncbi:MAG TPA: hypothetical protein PK514_05540 [Spirochaetota bacterium]|nr:hypothetical protein [Spirochaetota bacterium]